MAIPYPISLRSESANVLHAYSEIGMRRASTWTKSQVLGQVSPGTSLLFYISINTRLILCFIMTLVRTAVTPDSAIPILGVDRDYPWFTPRKDHSNKTLIEKYTRRSGNRERETDNQPTVQVQYKVSS